MTIAKCSRCGGKAQGKSFEEASSRINHAVGLSRGIKCGDNYNCVLEIESTPKVESSQDTTNDLETSTPKATTDTVSESSNEKPKKSKFKK